MKRCLTFSSGVLLRHPPPKNIHDVAVLIETNLESRVRHASASLCPMATVYNDAAVSNGSRREISDRTRRPGAWRIGGWGLRRRTRNGEYQLRGFLATDIPNHCRRMKSFSESSTGRISRAWHIRGTLPEGRTHDGKYQLGHNVPTDIPLRFRLFWARENPVPF